MKENIKEKTELEQNGNESEEKPENKSEEKPAEELTESTEAPAEKSEIQIEVEKLRAENQGLKSDLGRVPELQSRVDGLNNKVEELLEARQVPSTEGTIDDDEYITRKSLKENEGDREAAFENWYAKREGKKTKWNEDYTKQVAKSSMDITDDETLTGILNEMDSNFRDDSITDPAVQAEVNYAKAKASYVTKAMSAGKQVKFASNKPSALPLGGGATEKIIQREEKERTIPDDAKALLNDSWFKDKTADDKKKLVSEALS